eukprot:6397464-Amphidinium_carterae.1
MTTVAKNKGERLSTKQLAHHQLRIALYGSAGGLQQKPVLESMFLTIFIFFRESYWAVAESAVHG